MSEKKQRTGVGLSVLWLVIAGAGFAALYWSLLNRIADDELLVQVLRGLAWPFVAFAISLPVVLILNANMAQLIAIKRTLDEAPDKLMHALDGVAKFKDNIDEIRAQLSNDLNETLSGAEMRLAAVSEKIAATSGDGGVAASSAPTSRERLSEHNDTWASPLLSNALEAYNSDRRRTPLTINRGGGNRPELVAKLRDAVMFHADLALNRAVGDYLIAVYTALNNRRGVIGDDVVRDLDSRRDELVRRGAISS
jgi:hypothetical protein